MIATIMTMRAFVTACCLLMIDACADRPLVYGQGEGQGGTGQSGDLCGDDQPCADGAECVEGVCVQSGLIRVTLSWSVVTDLDLHVETPTGVHVYYADPQRAGLSLDVDDCVGGDCRDNGGTHVENIFFEESAERGTYRVWVRNFDGRRAADYQVEVVGEVAQTWSGTLDAIEGADSPVRTFTW